MMKRGFLFSMDALLAAVILIGGLVLIGSIVDSDTDTSKLATASEDTIVALQSVKLYDINDPWLVGLIANQTITDENVSVLEQVGYFWALGRSDDARRLAELLLNESYPGFGVRLTLDGTAIYERTLPGATENLVVANRLVTGVAQGEAIKGSSASGYLRKIKDKRNFVIIPFGGFVGEGNVSVESNAFPDDANVTALYLELDAERDFDFYINNVLCDSLSPNASVLVPSAWDLNCTGLVDPTGNNVFSLNFSGSINGSFVAGGFIKVSFTTDQFNIEQNLTTTVYSFPHIEGLINLFDGFYIPGTVGGLNATLHFLANYTSYFTIGNASWTFAASPFEQTITLNDSTIAAGFASAGMSVADVSEATVPLRFGIGSVVTTGAPADAIVVTDTSGSMGWCVDHPSCTPDANIRLDVAKTAIAGFINYMLNFTGPRVGLVEFGTSTKSMENLTDNATFLINEVNTYNDGGATCICCGVNDAAGLLNQDQLTLLIPRSSSNWRVNTDDLSSPPAGWTTLGFDDSSWDLLDHGVGWGYSGLSTYLSGGDRYDGDYYHRKKFNVTNASDIQGAALYVYSDDGADVYLNGNLIDNDYGNRHSAFYWNRNAIFVDPADFVEGENILAVRQWHRYWWSWMGFNLEMLVNYQNSSIGQLSKNMVVMSDGAATQECAQQNTGDPSTDAIQSACDAYNNWGYTVYTVGFGSDADVATLSAMANCTNGEYFDAQNSTALNDAFGQIAGAIIDASSTQRAIIEGNVQHTILYADSVLKANYTPSITPPMANEISLRLQSEPLSNCSALVELHQGSRFLDGVLHSYSGDFWTSLLDVNGTVVYNLTEFAPIYASLGDPYKISIQPGLLFDGNNSVTVNIATEGFNQSSICSSNNSIIYSIAVNLSTERSDAVPLAEGCKWSVEILDGSVLNLTIPSTYNGTNICVYNSTNVTYNPNDAYQLGAYLIFERLDFTDENKLFVNLDEEDLEVIVTTIGGVPYLWGPITAKVEVMR